MPNGSSRPVLVVGAGPAGLATAYELARRGIPYRLFERGAALGHTWRELYDSLTLHTGKHMSTLPGLTYPRSASLFPTRAEFIDYLERYATAHRLAVETNRDMVQLAPSNGGWSGRLRDGEQVEGRAVVLTTGIVANPRVPALEGRERFRGTVMHSVDYRRPAPFVGKQVLVVGVGNSGGEIGAELARAGAQVTVAVRSGNHVVPKQLGPFPLQYLRYWLGKLPRGAQEVVLRRIQARMRKKFGPPVLPLPSYSPLDAIPLIGFHLVDAIREGLVDVVRAEPVGFTEHGVRFSDGSERAFDAVLLATGFKAAVGPLGNLVQTDAKGFALRTDRVTSADARGLYFVGQNYDHTGGLTNIRRDAPLAAELIARGR